MRDDHIKKDESSILPQRLLSEGFESSSHAPAAGSQSTTTNNKNNQETETEKSDIFAKVNALIISEDITLHQQQLLKKWIVDDSGTVEESWTTNVTHIITRLLPDYIPAILKLKQIPKNVFIVRPSWVLKSVKMGERLPERMFTRARIMMELESDEEGYKEDVERQVRVKRVILEPKPVLQKTIQEVIDLIDNTFDHPHSARYETFNNISLETKSTFLLHGTDAGHLESLRNGLLASYVPPDLVTLVRRMKGMYMTDHPHVALRYAKGCRDRVYNDNPVIVVIDVTAAISRNSSNELNPFHHAVNDGWNTFVFENQFLLNRMKVVAAYHLSKEDAKASYVCPPDGADNDKLPFLDDMCIRGNPPFNPFTVVKGPSTIDN